MQPTKNSWKELENMKTEKNPTPLVSVVMPVKNRQDTLHESIESILNQSLNEIELIIVDDHSTDGSNEILYDYEKKDSRVRVVESKGNGIAEALNSGIEHVQAPLIARMDADDISSKHRLKHQYEKFESNKNLVLLGSNYYVFNGEIDNIEAAITPPMDNEKLKLSIQSFSTFAHPTIMMRTEAIRKIGGYRKFFEGAEDHDLYLRLFDLGEFATLPEFLFYYRSHPNQISQKKYTKGMLGSVAAVFCFQYFRENKIDPLSSDISCEELIYRLLKHRSENTELMSKDNVNLCIRAIQGLAMLSKYKVEIQTIRRKIAMNLIRHRKFQRSFKFWRMTQRSNWLEHKETE